MNRGLLGRPRGPKTGIELIQEVEVGPTDGQVFMDFPGIPQTFGALQLLITARSAADAQTYVRLRFNGSAATDYYGIAQGVVYGAATGGICGVASRSGSGTPYATWVDIPFYTKADWPQNFRGWAGGHNGSGFDYALFVSLGGMWGPAAPVGPVNWIQLYLDSGANFSRGSRARLLGTP